MKLPAFQMYPGDWMKDPTLRAVSSACRGLWIDMLCLMFESPKRGYLMLSSGLAPTAEQLSRMTGNAESETKSMLDLLENCGVFSRSEEGIIYCRRMVRDERKRRKCQRAGKLGGNPTLKGAVKGGVNRDANRKPTPSSSSSSSPSGIESRERESFAERPSLKEVTDYATSPHCGLAAWKAEDWWNEMEGSGWVDHLRRSIHDWRAVLRRVACRWRADGAPSAPVGRPQPAGATSQGERPRSVFELQAIIKAKETLAADIKLKYCSETASGLSWSDIHKRQEYFTIRKEIKEITAKIGRMA
jgi:hypothetical protein